MKKITVIGHMHVNPDNREPFELLMEEFELKMLYPKKWSGAFNEKYENSDGISVLRLPILKNSYIPFFGKDDECDILWVDEEPVYPQMHYILEHFKKTPFKIIRTAQNIEKRDIYRNIMNSTANRSAQSVVAVSVSSQNCAKKIFDREDVPIIPLSIPDRFFAVSSSRDFGREVLTIGFASRFEECKGIRWFLDSISNIKTEFKLLLAGDGSMKNYMMKRLNESKIDYQYKGLIDHLKMDEFYKEADIFVNTSVSQPNWTEQQGKAVLESMASGCALISSSSGELKNTINGAGILVREGDINGLSEAIDELLRNREKIFELSEIGKKEAVKYGKFEIFKKIHNVISKYESDIS